MRWGTGRAAGEAKVAGGGGVDPPPPSARGGGKWVDVYAHTARRHEVTNRFQVEYVGSFPSFALISRLNELKSAPTTPTAPRWRSPGWGICLECFFLFAFVVY